MENSNRLNERMKNNGPKIGFNTGTSFMLVIFILLCLVVFSVLSLVSANADYKLSRSIADHTSDYYAATSEVYRELAALAAEERDMDELKDFTVNMGDNQQIHVTAWFPATGFDQKMAVKSWRVENTGELAIDTTELPELSLPAWPAIDGAPDNSAIAAPDSSSMAAPDNSAIAAPDSSSMAAPE